jgi:hypothetical protein
MNASVVIVNREDIGPQIDQLLEQAAGFARGGDLSGAVDRAYWARNELDSHTAALVVTIGPPRSFVRASKTGSKSTNISCKIGRGRTPHARRLT